MKFLFNAFRLFFQAFCRCVNRKHRFNSGFFVREGEPAYLALKTVCGGVQRAEERPIDERTALDGAGNIHVYANKGQPAAGKHVLLLRRTLFAPFRHFKNADIVHLILSAHCCSLIALACIEVADNGA